MTGLRKFRLSAVVATIMLSGYFFTGLYKLGEMTFDSYTTSNLLIGSFQEIIFNGLLLFLVAHVLSGPKAKQFGIIALILLGSMLIEGLANYIWRFQSENSIFNLVNSLTTLAFYIVLGIGCKRQYRLGLIALSIGVLFNGIVYGPIVILPTSILWNLLGFMCRNAIFTIGWCALLYQGLQLPGKKTPQTLCLDIDSTQGSVIYKVFNLIAAAFILIFIIFAVFFKPGMGPYGAENFMPAGGLILEVTSLAIMGAMIVQSIRFKTLALKITGLVMVGLLLTIHLVCIGFCIAESRLWLEGLNVTNLITIGTSVLLTAIWLWMAKVQSTGPVRRAMAFSVATSIAVLSIMPKYSFMEYYNYGGYGEDKYFSAVIIILAFFLVAPWLLLHLVKQSWPKMRMIFMAIPLGVVMLGFTVLRLNMNGSWNRSTNEYSYPGLYNDTETAVDNSDEDSVYLPAPADDGVPICEEDEESEMY